MAEFPIKWQVFSSSALAEFKTSQGEFSNKVIYNLLKMETFQCFHPAVCRNKQCNKSFPWLLVAETTGARPINYERRTGN